MARFGLTLLLLISTVGFAGTEPQGCGPEDQAWSVDVKILPAFAIPNDSEQSTVVFLNRGAIGVYQLKVAADGEWRAATKRNSYAAFQLPAGEHYICMATFRRAQAWIPLKTEAGKTYFLMDDEPVIGKPAIMLMDADNAKAQLASLKVSISHPKKRP